MSINIPHGSPLPAGSSPSLGDWVERLRSKGLLVGAGGPTHIPIDRLTADSRKVGPSTAFVAIRGTSTDGHLFIDKAVLNGATAIVCEAGPDGMSGPVGARETRAPNSDAIGSPAWIQVSDSRQAWVELASLMQGDPGSSLRLSAVTGTNGKSSVVTLLHHVLNTPDAPCGIIGTTGIMDGRTYHAATHTTPAPDTLMTWLAAMRENGCTNAVMEASSHAIDQHRLRFSDVDLALFTNLTRDHLDYHGSLESYFEAKKGLFDVLSKDARAITNIDDPRGARIVADTQAAITTIGSQAHKPDADIVFALHSEALDGLHLMIDGDTRRYRLAGAYNAFNLAAAYAAARALGIERAEALDQLADCPPVRGRFEQLRSPDGRTVIVDYAHTPDALENVLRTSRNALNAGSSAFPDARLFCLFGCGGDRDRGKRPQMGGIAERLADRVFVTSDNPRSEDPARILDDIRAGFDRPEEATLLVDRREAIQVAIADMRPGDVFILAGKGHETTQVLADATLHFDDREEARQVMGLISPDTHTG